MLRSLILYHLLSGQAFFSGTACLLSAVALSTIARKRWFSILRNVFVGLGGSLIALSAVPLPPLLYAVWLASVMLWVAGEHRKHKLSKRLVLVLRGLVVLASLASVGLEIPYHRTPRTPRMDHPTLGVIGDSITAGLGDPAVTTWPKRLAQEHGVKVRDHSEPGASVASALRQAEALVPNERLVVLEIGGNDVLSGSTPEAFEAGLERLLQNVCRPGRFVVMLELPLPPTYNSYGLIQRRLARRFGVSLVPRRLLLGVLLEANATVDSVHLTDRGQAELADSLWCTLRSVYFP